MKSGASSPEELESLFEDAFITRDRDAIVRLFDRGAVLVERRESRQTCGEHAIRQRADALCRCGYSYVANPLRVLRSGDTTLVISDEAVNVMRRGHDSRWRYAITLLNPPIPPERSS